MSKQDKAIAIATAIATAQKTKWRQIDAAAKNEKAKKEKIQSRLMEIRGIAFREAVREVYGNGYYKD